MIEPDRGDDVVAVWKRGVLTLTDGPVVRFREDGSFKRGWICTGQTDGQTVMTMTPVRKQRRPWLGSRFMPFSTRFVVAFGLGDKTIPAVAFAWHAYASRPSGGGG
jgi:hypothetical protein